MSKFMTQRNAIIGAGVILFLGLWQVLSAGAQKEIAIVAIPGLSTGAIYALVALGIALVYKATKVFNFAQGEFGTIPVFISWLLLTRGVDPAADRLAEASSFEILLTMIAGVMGGVIVALLVYLLVVRPLGNAGGVTTLVATAGVSLFLISFEIIRGEAQIRPYPNLIDGSPCFGTSMVEGVERCTSPLSIGTVIVSWNTLLIFAVLIVVAALLGLFFKTPAGTALLATSQDGFAAELYGVSTNTMSMITWGAAGLLGGLGGVLAVGISDTFTPGFVTATYLVAGFTAAILGGITSMPGAVVGGLLLGVVQALSNRILPGSISGKAQVGVFAVLLLVLLFRPRGLLGKAA